MIYIEKNKDNKFALTLSESSRIPNPVFLFDFKGEYDLDSNSILWTSPDISNYTNRYNEFILTEASSGSTTGGTSSLNLITGQYSYTVYEFTGRTYTTLAISATTGIILEEGRLVVAPFENTTITTGITASIYI